MTRQRTRIWKIEPVWLLIPLLIFCGCRQERNAGNAVARVGKSLLSPQEVSDRAAKPYDSLTAAERSLLIDGWVTEQLYKLEGDRLGLDKDPLIKEQLASLRAELYRSRMLHDAPRVEPSDSAIALYYAAHREEFLRGADSYLLDLFWGADRVMLEQFRAEYARGDTSRIARREITAEGKWLAEAGELDADLSKELSQLKKGSFSRVRPADDGFRMLLLREVYPAGTILDLAVVRSDIVGRMLIESGRARQDSLLEALKLRWPVEVLLEKEGK